MNDDILVGKITKNSRALIELRIRKYSGHEFLDIREFYLVNEDGTFHELPTRKGITLKLQKIPLLIKLLEEVSSVSKINQSHLVHANKMSLPRELYDKYHEESRKSKLEEELRAVESMLVKFEGPLYMRKNLQRQLREISSRLGRNTEERYSKKTKHKIKN